MEIAPGLHSIGQRKGGRVHAFLLDSGSDLILIDTLFDGDGRGVLQELERLGRRASEIERIVLTHAHRSHLGGAAVLKRLTGATVYSHEWEADIVEGDRRAQPVTLRPIPPLRIYPFRIGLALGRPKHVPCQVDEALSDGDEVGPVQVLHTPGHSPGHLAFHWPERHALIAGDAIATWPRFGDGWPGFNLNLKQQRESLRRMAALDARVVGVGHGEPITEAAAERLHGLLEGR